MIVACQQCGCEFDAGQSTRLHCSASCAGKSAHPPRHGLTFSKIHFVWREMRRRCDNPNNKSYPHYGGRGIRVCERWSTFENFLEDMGPRPTPEHTIDRIDCNGNYEPGNCRWATRTEQSRNRRGVSTPEFDQKIRDAVAAGLNFTQMAALLGKSKGAVASRAYRIGLKSGVPPIPKKGSEVALHNHSGANNEA